MKKNIARDALKFILLLSLITLLSYGLLSIPLFSSGFSAFTAIGSQCILSFLGIPSTVVYSANPHLVGRGFDAELIDLCWGKLEIALLAGIIFASTDRTLKRRITGLVGGVCLALLFNPLRIAITLKYFTTEPLVAVALHDILFRLSLIAVIVVYYAAWYYSGRDARCKRF